MKDIYKINEYNAELMMDEGKLDEAEMLLLQNVSQNISSAMTYHLMIKIYKAKGDYKKLVSIINAAIKNCKGNRQEFKELRKVVVLNRLLKDIFE